MRAPIEDRRSKIEDRAVIAPTIALRSMRSKIKDPRPVLAFETA
jgi:hypothetical protein